VYQRNASPVLFGQCAGHGCDHVHNVIVRVGIDEYGDDAQQR
jgi:hypothetical protein